jgi:hypothetical protein
MKIMYSERADLSLVPTFHEVCHGNSEIVMLQGAVPKQAYVNSEL